MPKLTLNRIKELLARKGRTNKELAEFLGKKPLAVSTWCRNRNQPELATLFQIAEFLDVEPGELLTPKKDLRPVKEKGVAKVTKKKAVKKV